MCGIMGYVGKKAVNEILIKGLKRLEYRGYDSAGVAYFKDGRIEVKKSEGKIANVERLVNGAAKLGADGKNVQCGIGHTRWATHGKPTTQNAHPHRAEHIVLVHNGIIENYLEIREELLQEGYRPQSETDSELYGFLVLDRMKKGLGFIEATRAAFEKLEGACSVVVMSEKEPGTIVGIRNGSPLVAAIDREGGIYFASDAQPILDYEKNVTFLDHGDVAIGKNGSLSFLSLHTGQPLKRSTTRIDWSSEDLDKQGYPHYMLKEIFEQPNSLTDTFNGLLDRARATPFPLAAQPGVDLLNRAQSLTLVACGTSSFAGLQGKYWIERWAGIPVNLELASEFRYRDPVVSPGTVVVGISQSGETADTLAVIREMKKKGVPSIAITNVRGSTISRESDATFYTSAGPEIGVAATKTFTAQMMVLFLWAAHLGMRRYAQDSSRQRQYEALFQQLLSLPHALSAHLEKGSDFSNQVRAVAQKVQSAHGFFFIGRGYSYPLAMEGALKLKEIAYIHAEGYAGGELKHGPIAMIDQNIVVVVFAPRDTWYEKTVSNLQEVKARGAIIVGVGHSDDRKLQSQSDHWIPIPEPVTAKFDESLFPFLLTPALQLLAYEIAVLRGTDVDQPRNLAKSVTVE